MNKRKYSNMVVRAVEMMPSADSYNILSESVHEKAAVRSVGQEVVTIDDYNGSGDFDTTWEKVEF